MKILEDGRWIRPLAAMLAMLSFPVASMAENKMAGDEISKDKTVDQEILDILRREGKIDEARYEELSQQAEEEAAAARGGPEDFTIRFSNGLRINRNDGQVKLKLGGRIQADFASISVDQDLKNTRDDFGLGERIGGDGEGVEFRRTRIYVSGELYDRIYFKSQYDFAGGDVSIKDNYIGMKGIPWLGKIQFGHMKEPFSLEELTSSKNITFVERSLGSIFDSSRNFGVLFKNTYFDKRMTASAGVFAETGSTGKYFSDDTDMNVTGRITGLPLYQDDGRFLIHLGASLIQRISDDAERRFRQRPEIHLAKRYVDTGEYDSDGASILGLEFAAILGPVSIQAEHRHAFIDNRGPSSLGDPITNNNFQIHASNVELSWFVTGENRNYQTSSGTLGRITPKRAFDPEGGGYGAWEVAVRYSHIDLQDEGMNGGEEQNVTVGTNWYLYSNVRLSLNYVYADVDDTGDFLGNASGDLHSVHSRLQVDF